MIRKATWLLLAIGVTTSAAAQVNKCKGPDGRVVFSDVPCASGSKTENIKIVPGGNSLDSAGDRAAAAEYRRQADYEALMRNTPQECQFEGRSGKRLELARRATQECVRNVIAERDGGKRSEAALQAYKENEDHRKRLVESAAASGGRRTITCTGMGPGMATCR